MHRIGFEDAGRRSSDAPARDNETRAAIREAVSLARDCTDPYTGEPGYWIPAWVYRRLRRVANDPLPEGAGVVAISLGAASGGFVVGLLWWAVATYGGA